MGKGVELAQGFFFFLPIRLPILVSRHRRLKPKPSGPYHLKTESVAGPAPDPGVGLAVPPLDPDPRPGLVEPVEEALGHLDVLLLHGAEPEPGHAGVAGVDHGHRARPEAHGDLAAWEDELTGGLETLKVRGLLVREGGQEGELGVEEVGADRLRGGAA